MRNLYTLTDDNKPIPAPTTCKVDGVTYAMPTQATLRLAHIYAYPLVSMADEPRPPAVEGKIVVFDGYEIRDGAIHPKFRYDDAPAPELKAYDRYKVVTALKAEGVWRDVRAAMLAQDEDALDMLYTADDISEDEPLLLAMIAMLKAAPYSWTDKKISALLKRAEI